MKLISSVASLCLISSALATYHDGYDSYNPSEYVTDVKDVSTTASDSIIPSSETSSKILPAPETSTLQTETVFSTETPGVTPTPSSAAVESTKSSCQKTSLPVVTGEPASIVDPMIKSEHIAPYQDSYQNVDNTQNHGVDNTQNQDLENGDVAQNEIAIDDLGPDNEFPGIYSAQPTETLDANHAYETEFDPNLISGDVRNMAYGTLIFLAMAVI